ncbi:MAG: cupredoxin domain-containing protein [Chitinophagales bacterium]|nr:cupredoxin domain-containing protein [Chitinophagales bacterium]
MNTKTNAKQQTKIFSLLLIAATTSLIFSCGSGDNATKETSADTVATDSYKPESATAVYDAAKIDANAPVMEVKLDALGNSMDVMSFSMPEIRVKAGSTVKIYLNNTSKDAAMKHNFFIVKNGTMEDAANAALTAGSDKNYIPDDKTNILYTSKILDPGQSEELVFAAPPVGEYQFVCTYPGHWQKMNGKFIVE